MSHTDDQLRALLAKMLPETVKYDTFMSPPTLRWNHSVMVRVTELLHLTSLAEAELTVEEDHDYLDALARIVDPMFGYRGELTLGIITATWQQRTTALAEVLGVTL